MPLFRLTHCITHSLGEKVKKHTHTLIEGWRQIWQGKLRKVLPGTIQPQAPSCGGSCSVMSDSETACTVAYWTSLSMEFSRQEYWSILLHSLLQGIFPTQGSNPCLLHCRQILYHSTHQGSPKFPPEQLQIPDWCHLNTSWKLLAHVLSFSLVGWCEVQEIGFLCLC